MTERYTLIHVVDGCAALGTSTVKTPIAVRASFEAALAAAEGDLRERARDDDDVEEQVFIMRTLLTEGMTSRNDEGAGDPSYYVIVANRRQAA